MSNTRLVAIDLFCGAGGLTYGLEQAGLRVAEGVDVDPNCKYPFEANNSAKFVCKDIRKYTLAEAERAWKGASTRILVGCAPCQPFSTYTQGPRGNHKQRWILLRRFGELVEQMVPDVVSMENVTPLEGTTPLIAVENFFVTRRNLVVSLAHIFLAFREVSLWKDLIMRRQNSLFARPRSWP